LEAGDSALLADEFFDFETVKRQQMWPEQQIRATDQ
jgi:hypothetical protein